MTPTLIRFFSARFLLLLALCSASAWSATLEDADAVFAWAEQEYASLFAPAGQTSQSLAGYRLRYYPDSNSYLGVNEADTPNLYYLGPASDNQLLDLGVLSGWLAQLPATASSLTLLETSDGFWCGIALVPNSCADTELAWPYAMTTSAAASVSCTGSDCATAYEVGSFKLTATGQNFTIINLAASNAAPESTLVPRFDGLAEGLVIANGQTVAFKLLSPFTRGESVLLNYAFTVQETGQTFSYTVQLQTN